MGGEGVVADGMRRSSEVLQNVKTASFGAVTWTCISEIQLDVAEQKQSDGEPEHNVVREQRQHNRDWQNTRIQNTAKRGDSLTSRTEAVTIEGPRSQGGRMSGF